MRFAILLGVALLALPLVGCCPGSMMGEHAQVQPMAQPVDSDGDGVPDALDRCPDTPHGVAVDEHGCPKDADGDGVPDYLDKCPNTPHGVAVDSHGCPLDADADGVPDYLDKCPDTPRGEKVNRDGCSDAQLAAMAPKPAPSRAERELAEKGEIRLENVYFESGSSKLTPASSDALDEAGKALEKYPALKLEVQGHTDKTGPAKLNMRLSQSRAESVRKYLIDHFKLEPGNIRAKGYGETQPETPERTAEEKQRDRRVVLKVLNPGALPKNVEIAH
jgi:OOP family OmpA-OmpF porin